MSKRLVPPRKIPQPRPHPQPAPWHINDAGLALFRFVYPLAFARLGSHAAIAEKAGVNVGNLRSYAKHGYSGPGKSPPGVQYVSLIAQAAGIDWALKSEGGRIIAFDPRDSR